MTLFRKHFPEKTIPKQHILEKHCTNWIRMYGFGMGMHGEQGGEFVHSTISKFEIWAGGIRNKILNSKGVMKAHLLNTSPTVNALIPLIKNRKTE